MQVLAALEACGVKRVLFIGVGCQVGLHHHHAWHTFGFRFVDVHGGIHVRPGA